jgi:hypothetical protein
MGPDRAMSSKRIASTLKAALIAGCAAASYVCAPRSNASTAGPAVPVRCLRGETCGYTAQTFRTGNCCGYAAGPFPDALACKAACAEHAAAAGRASADCMVQGQRQCDQPGETWYPCAASSGASEDAGRCVLSTGQMVSCVCR